MSKRSVRAFSSCKLQKSCQSTSAQTRAAVDDERAHAATRYNSLRILRGINFCGFVTQALRVDCVAAAATHEIPALAPLPLHADDADAAALP